MKITRNILIVEDDKSLADFLARRIQEAGLSALVAYDFEQASKYLTSESVHLVLLDLALGKGPGGMMICRAIKSDVRTRAIPVIILTGNPLAKQEYKSFEQGADLYLRKPIIDEVLISYVESFLNRVPYKDEIKGIMVFAGIVLDPKTSGLSVGGRTYLGLPENQFEFLVQLAAFRGKPATREYLAGKIWRKPVHSRHVDTVVSRLKKRLDPADAARIASVRRVGYYLTSAAG